MPWRDRRHRGVLSVLVDDPRKKRRRLPTLYLRTAPVFAARELGPVTERLSMIVATIASSTPTYLTHPVEANGKVGLYVRDIYNRSAFRRRLARLGMRFGDDPFARLTERGFFSSSDFGEFRPGFIILDEADPEEPKKIVTTRGALIPFHFAILRFGAIPPSELSTLTRALKNTPAISAGDANVLMAAL